MKQKIIEILADFDGSPKSAESVADEILRSIGSEVNLLDKRCFMLNKAVCAVNDLIENSDGVSGLHLNGDVALWADLEEGGALESWLIDLSLCNEIIGKKNDI